MADANGIAGIEIDEDKTLFVNVLEEKSKAVKTSLAAKSNGTVKVGSGNFEIVLGCFSIRQNATRMVEKLALKQVDAYVSGRNHKGMHVVSLGRFASKEEALSRLLQIKDNFPNAWIKKPE